MKPWALLLLAGVFACGPHRETVSAADRAPAATAGAGGPSKAGAAGGSGSSLGDRGQAAQQADQTIATTLSLVSQVRQLPAKKAVPGVRLDRAALRAEVVKMLGDESPKEAIEGNTEVLFALDTVPENFDLQATLTLLLGLELAGFYDPKSKRMVLLNDLGEYFERITLYHELVHALQDQNFDLSAAFDYRPEQSDVQGALHALAEGDATSAMMDVSAAASGVPATQISSSAFRLDSMMMQASPDLASVPPIVARSLIAPYVDGVAFVNHLRAHGGWPAVNRAFEKPPASTEQILHPERYLSGEAVVPVPTLQPPPGFGDASFRDVMGEQGLRLLFEEWAPASEAARAASDWGGDRLAVFKQGDQRVVLWHLAFDNEAAARRALVLFGRGALRSELAAGSKVDPRLRPFASSSDATNAVRTDSFCRERARRGAFAVARHGRHIAVALGPYPRGVTNDRTSDRCTAALAWATALASPG